MCGIFGQITKNVSNLSIPEVHLLGVYNIERGKSSCGLSYDGDVLVGLDKDKLYSDFIKKRPIKPKKYPTIFGHTRQASVGGVNIFNVHPFGFGKLDNGDYEFIACHNGTLKNHKELADKYDVDTKEEYINNLGNKESRDKIDSEILLEILWKTKSYKVLSEYIGGAALAWTWIGEPNKMYLWSGASKEYPSLEKITEERPLCIFQRSKNCTFFSSMEESLFAVGGTEDTVHQIQHNTVYCITDGDFKNAEMMIVSRRNASQNESYTYKSQTANFTTRDQDYYNGINESISKRNAYINKNSESLVDKYIRQEVNIHKEQPVVPHNVRGGKVYFQGLRYQRNGHRIHGIFTYIPKFGFYELGISLKDAENTIKANTGVRFVNGVFDKTCKDKDLGIVPFRLHNKPPLFFFIQGAMVKTFSDYTRLCNQIKCSTSKDVAVVPLSHCTKHPITSITQFGTTTNQGVYFNGTPANGTFCPLGSERIYTFEKGNLVGFKIREDFNITFKKPEEKPVIQLPINMNNFGDNVNFDILGKSKKNIELLEAENTRKEDEALFTQQSDDALIETMIEERDYELTDTTEEDMNNEDTNQMIDQLVDEELVDPILKLNKLRGDLEQFSGNKKAEKWIKLIAEINAMLTTCTVVDK